MDYYQGVVMDYLRTDRAVFVNPECCIQISDGPEPEHGGTHWFCDAVAVDLRNEKVFLCEISFAKGLGKLIQRLRGWGKDWDAVKKSLVRDCHVQGHWQLRPWLFVPEKEVASLVQKLNAIKGSDGLSAFEPRITPLECVQPWRNPDFNHQDKDTKKPECVPEAMRC
ncbi:MAG: hypothetical protein WBW84_17525 [Acidobacteriaceae bacterium]